MRVPAAHIDETNAVFVAHQPAHALGLKFESLGVDGIAVGRIHLALHFLRHLLPQLESVAYGPLQMMACIHVAQNSRLTLIEGGFAHILE